jgi:hypothetical protein
VNAQLAPADFTPGSQSRIPFEVYQGMAGMNISLLKEMRRSAQHFAYRRRHPKESAPLTLGRAAHCAVLEPERFDADHAVWDRRQSNGNMAPRNGQHWDTFRAENPGRAIITADEAIHAHAMQAAVRGNADAMKYLVAGDPEVTMQAVIADRPCKGRLDWLARDWFDPTRPALVGLKSARDCRPFHFGRQAANLGYHLQWGFYLDLFKAITGHPNPKVVEIVVESEPPHAVSVFVVPDEVLQQGCNEYLELLAQLDECERANFWPGPVSGEQELTLPEWVYGKEEIIYVDE